MTLLKNISLLLVIFILAACEQYEDLNTNPNEPTNVSADVLLPGAIRTGVNASVDASFLVGNVAAQLSAKTLRLEVDAYTWNAFPKYWEAWYESLSDVRSIEKIALEQGSDNLEGVAVVLRSWVIATLTNAYGDIPYSEAIRGDESNFTPIYDDQQAIYADLLSELARADQLLASDDGSINGDILFNGEAAQWRKFANALRLRLLMHAGDKIADAGSQFKSITDAGNIPSSNADNIILTYTGSTPNEFPIVPLKQGDFDAVALGGAAFNVMDATSDPRLLRYARPDNEDYTTDPVFTGWLNGLGEDCPSMGGSRLGAQYYNYPNLISADDLGLPMAEGIILSYAEVEFLLAEAIAKSWIDGDIESHYRAGIAASMEYYQVDVAPFGWSSFDDFYNNSGVAYSEVTDIWQQKWLALYFHGLEPYFEVRRWYHESGDSFDGIPFLEATCGNLNDDQLPLRFPYPGEEQSLNAINYDAAVSKLGGNSQNGRMWLMQ